MSRDISVEYQYLNVSNIVQQQNQGLDGPPEVRALSAPRSLVKIYLDIHMYISVGLAIQGSNVSHGSFSWFINEQRTAFSVCMFIYLNIQYIYEQL